MVCSVWTEMVCFVRNGMHFLLGFIEMDCFVKTEIVCFVRT